MNNIDSLDIEEVAGKLDIAVNLLSLLSEELDDLYECTASVEQAKTKQEQHEASSLLIIQAENRLKYLVALYSTAMEQVTSQKDVLDKMVKDSTEALKNEKQGDSNEDR